jgi:hypothetical protein
MTIILNGTAGITFPDGTTQVDGLSTPVPVADGGTGASTLAANRVLLGNGTSAVQTVAPGTTGNVLTSNGTTWTSATPQAVPESNNDQVFTSSGTFNVPAGVSRVKVTVIGAGGNGGSGQNAVAFGGGGGGGGYVVDYVAVTPGGTATVTVGTNAGTRTSSFAGVTTITAAGGSNGGNASGSNGLGGATGASTVFGVNNYTSGTRRTGDNSYFTSGAWGLATGTSTSNWDTGFVYDHGFGVAGDSRLPETGFASRQTPLGYGAGGGGGSATSGATGGGVGVNGLVIVEW